MKLLLRSLLLACLSAVALPALADDSSAESDSQPTSSEPAYYLRCEKTNDNASCPNVSDTYKELFKFTRVGDSNEYQLAVEHLCSAFYIEGVNGSQTIRFGSSDSQELNASIFPAEKIDDVSTASPALDGDEQKTYESQSFTLVKDGANNITGTEFNKGDYNIWVIKHILLTLTIDPANSDQVSLKVEHLNNTSLKKGVPTILYVLTSDMPFTENKCFLQGYRLIKSSDDTEYKNYYTTTAKTIKGDVIIKDGPTHGSPYCISLHYRTGGTYIAVETQKIDGVETAVLLDHYNGSDFVSGTTATNTSDVIAPNNDGVYTVKKEMYQGKYNGGATNFTVPIYNVNLTFIYDIATASSVTGYTTSDPTLQEQQNITYTNGEEYVTTENTKYNGTLMYEFTLTPNTNYCITYASDKYVYSKAINLEGNNQLVAQGGNFYMVYEKSGLTTSGDKFDTAFYIKGFEGESLATAEESTIMQYAPDVNTDKDCVVHTYKYYWGDEVMWSDVMQFIEQNANRWTYGFPFTDTAMQDPEYEKIPYYVLCSSSIKVTFRYNIYSPNKSLVTVETTGVMTGAEEIAADVEDAPVEYFNLSGVKVNGSMPGLYIRRQGSKVSKVVVR